MKRPGPFVNYILPTLLVIASIIAIAGSVVADRIQTAKRAKADEGKNGDATQGSDLNSAVSIEQKNIERSALDRPSVLSETGKTQIPTPVPTPAYRPYPAYDEVFEGLSTKDWYYHDYNASLTREHRYNDHRKRGFDPDDIHALPLLRLKQGHKLSFEEESGLQNIRKLVQESDDIFEVAFMRGERIPMREVPHAPLDTPVCILRIHGKNMGADSFHFFTVASSDVVEPQPGIRGVRIISEPNPFYIGREEQGRPVTSLECVVRESEPNLELHRKLSLIHLSATLGIHCEIFER